MACFVVPLGEAIVTTVIQKVVEHKEHKVGAEKPSTGITWGRRLSWLNKMLWGGSIMLVFDHIWNGEVVFRPPFFTAMETTGGLAPMLREMATLGVAMAAAVTAVWGIVVVVAELKAKARVRQDLQQL
jgi:hypothetical protein